LAAIDVVPDSVTFISVVLLVVTPEIEVFPITLKTVLASTRLNDELPPQRC